MIGCQYNDIEQSCLGISTNPAMRHAGHKDNRVACLKCLESVAF